MITLTVRIRMICNTGIPNTFVKYPKVASRQLKAKVDMKAYEIGGIVAIVVNNMSEEVNKHQQGEGTPLAQVHHTAHTEG